MFSLYFAFVSKSIVYLMYWSGHTAERTITNDWKNIQNLKTYSLNLFRPVTLLPNDSIVLGMHQWIIIWAEKVFVNKISKISLLKKWKFLYQFHQL